MPTLIYCAERNARFSDIARCAGFELGAQLPNRVYCPPLYFTDQDWKHPNRDVYLQELETYRPHMASVLDWEHEEQLPEVLAWAEDAAPFVNIILIIPKVIGGVIRIPRIVGGKPVRLAYSVPTKFGGSSVPLWEFCGWPVHLLGGSPHAQMRVAQYINVVSADGNMHNRMAMRGQFWSGYAPVKNAHDPRWPRLQEVDMREWGNDAIYEAFSRSCKNIVSAWSALCR